jgi:hypothetical protein
MKAMEGMSEKQRSQGKRKTKIYWTQICATLRR